ncbi:hypothetical protein N657DRAFT_168535 [Parathielavia appendiculata]|uniref:Uncharacterized protein n=1 Tax=Parathielavia appendiculata TaxID=2587402 RepID=A0AAN6Z052_9PEZI|nr:hypothetical protein N657DRAFT_168535 [Parathielavia appendiculata]
MRMELTKAFLSIAKSLASRRIVNTHPTLLSHAFGIGRILYSLLEHVYWHRPNDAARAVGILNTLCLVSLLTFMPTLGFVPASCRGTKQSPHRPPVLQLPLHYHRSQAVVFGCEGWVSQTLLMHRAHPLANVTLREQDSMVQVKGPEDNIMAAIKGLVEGTETWEQVTGRMEIFGGQEENE